MEQQPYNLFDDTLRTAWRAAVSFAVVVGLSWAVVQYYGFRPHFLDVPQAVQSPEGR
ncbi:MAG: hypothetical protein JSS27_01030 [Planctomycetes bacterium]|nr:hypothetical protein [Planctomycetota bacterium]